MAKITYATKIGINPKTVHINQVWDDDMNEIKTVVNGLDDDKADKTNVLELDNTTIFTPDADYEPATKKYVDDNAGGSPPAANVTVDTTNFDNNLSVADVNVQLALETLDDLVSSGASVTIDDVSPTVINGSFWYQPTTGILALGVDDYWVNPFTGIVSSTGGGVINLQKEITASYTVADSDNGYTIFINSASAVTITVPALTDNFECDFYNEGAGLVTFTNSVITLTTPDGTTLATNKVCALLKKLSTTTYILKGEMA